MRPSLRNGRIKVRSTGRTEKSCSKECTTPGPNARTSDFDDYMDRRRHSWLRPMKPSDRFLDDIIMNLPAVPEFGTMLDEPASDEDITDDEEGHEDDEEDDRVSSIADEEKDTPDSRNLSANSMHVSETNVRLISIPSQMLVLIPALTK